MFLYAKKRGESVPPFLSYTTIVRRFRLENRRDSAIVIVVDKIPHFVG